MILSDALRSAVDNAIALEQQLTLASAQHMSDVATIDRLTVDLAVARRRIAELEGQPPPPLPPPVGVLKHGVYTGPRNVNGWASFVAKTPKATVALDFLDTTRTWQDVASPNWLLDPWTTWLNANSSRKLVLSVPMLINSARGDYDNTSYDTHFRQLAQNIANRGIADQVIIRIGWEMNGTWFPWSATPRNAGESEVSYRTRVDVAAGGYRRMFKRIVGLFRSVSTAFRFDWCANGGSPNPEAWYPGDDVVDIIAIDQYDIVWQKPGGDPNGRWAAIQPNLAWHAGFAAAHKKAAAIDEWGVWSGADTAQGGGGDNPTYITNTIGWAASHGYEHIVYYNVSAGGPATVLESNPNSEKAYVAYVASLA